MKKLRNTGLFLLSLCCLTACFQGDHANDTDDANDAAGTGDPNLAREVTGVWLLSTDYNYQERCNYLPVEFVQNLFKLDESVELTKYDIPDGCEIRLNNGQKVGFYFDKQSPFASTFQSEYAFDKNYQPQQVDKARTTMDAADIDPAQIKEQSYHGPKPGGTSTDFSPTDASAKTGLDSSAGNDTSIHPSANRTPIAAHLTPPAKNTSTGVAVQNVGDKALWEPATRTLHVLHINHVFSVVVRLKGDEATAKQGAIDLARVLTSRLFDLTD
jgi:hypothetical protein